MDDKLKIKHLEERIACLEKTFEELAAELTKDHSGKDLHIELDRANRILIHIGGATYKVDKGLLFDLLASNGVMHAWYGFKKEMVTEYEHKMLEEGYPKIQKRYQDAKLMEESIIKSIAEDVSDIILDEGAKE
jgi:hypothetical protein